MILLDTLYPPSPAQLVDDCRALGAHGCWAYVLRRDAGGADLGLGGWTPAHVDALHGDARLAPGIVVPGNLPPAGQACVDALRAMRCDPVLGTDLELWSLPPTWWVDQLQGLEAGQGVRGIDYGTAATLGTYDPANRWSWLAAWVRTGVLEPVPALPSGRLAWQFVNDVPAPSGRLYDASVVDETLFYREDPMDPRVIVYLAYLTFAAVPSAEDLAFWVGHLVGQTAADGTPGSMQPFDVLAAIAASLGPTSYRSELAQLRADLESGSFPGVGQVTDQHIGQVALQALEARLQG